MSTRRIVFLFGRVELIVLVSDSCHTIATWWIGDVFLARCLGGRA